MENNMKLCINCKHYEGRWSRMFLRTISGCWLMPWCGHPNIEKHHEIDTVTGKKKFWPNDASCWFQRIFHLDKTKYCGEDGNWFEEK